MRRDPLRPFNGPRPDAPARRSVAASGTLLLAALLAAAPSPAAVSGGLFVAALFAAAPLPAAAQTPRQITAAERLRDAGRPGEAADSLLAYLREHPGDAGVRWRAAQLLAEAGETEAALAQYERAVAVAPADPWLRLEYADLLLASVEWGRAPEVLEPLVEEGPGGARTAGATAATAAPTPVPPEALARALSQLGTAAYWSGDLSEAVERFEAALALDPDRPEAVRQLREIRWVTLPWSRLGLEALDDNQPYRRARAALEAGLFLTPAWSTSFQVVPGVLEGPGGTEGWGEARAGLRGSLADARLDVTAHLGATWQEETEWLGQLGLALRLPGSLRLRAAAERERYLWTLASGDTLLPLKRLELALHRADAPRWAGEAALRRETFPDGNTVDAAWGWVLAPVLPWLRVGAAASRQDAEETRWAPLLHRYAPYFTPEDQTTWSLLAEVTAPVGAAKLRLDGSYGVRATEEAPISVVPLPGDPSPPSVAFYERSYTPWSAGARLEVPAGEAWTLFAEAERRETAYYDLTRASLALFLRVGAPPSPFPPEDLPHR